MNKLCGVDYDVLRARGEPRMYYYCSYSLTEPELAHLVLLARILLPLPLWHWNGRCALPWACTNPGHWARVSMLTWLVPSQLDHLSRLLNFIRQHNHLNLRRKFTRPQNLNTCARYMCLPRSVTTCISVMRVNFFYQNSLDTWSGQSWHQWGILNTSLEARNRGKRPALIHGECIIWEKHTQGHIQRLWLWQ